MSLISLKLKAREHAPFVRPKTTVQQIMFEVSLALLPFIAVMIYFYGAMVLVNFVVAALCCLITEALCLALRKQSLTTLSDGSALLTGLLLAACLPPGCPIWVTALAGFVAIGLAKQVFGGLGFNVFNPAMVGYAFVFLSFPTVFNAWPIPHHLDIDALSEATALGFSQMQLAAQWTIEEIQADANWQVSHAAMALNLAALIGGIALLLRGRIRWIIPTGVLAGLLVTGVVINLTTNIPMLGWQHGLLGGTLFTAFFIATDPVTSPTGKRAQWFYGLLIGCFILLGRVFGTYPDAAAFSILLANALVPFLDAFKPKTRATT